MSDRPILFSAPMVRALLAGTKTQTRRVSAKQDWPEAIVQRHPQQKSGVPFAIGDRLWVREVFSYETLDVDRNGFMPPWYWADGNPATGDFTKPKPSIHMPRWASRLTLTVTDVRVQQLQDISAEDARDEGVDRRSKLVRQMWLFGADKVERDRIYLDACRWEYKQLWDSLNVDRGFGWDTNPWIVAVSFDVQSGNIDARAA